MDERVAYFLSAVHASETCLGLEALHQAQQNRLPHLRTVYRWHRRFAGQLQYFPAFSLEQLGLVHLHVFVTRPDERWSRFPYAIESLWLTQNLVDPVLYLHCFVPAAHCAAVEDLLGSLELSHAGLSLVWSTNSYQRVNLSGFESLSSGFPQPVWPPARDAVPSDLMIAIPVVGEGWNQRVSLPGLWQRVQDRLGPRVRAYLGRRPYVVNGKAHMKQAYRALLREGAFRQYLIRYQDECSLLVVTPSYERSLPGAVGAHARAAEVFPTKDGGGLWRLQGAYDLLRSRDHLAGNTVYLVENATPPPVRWCYDWLFDPSAATWVFPTEQIKEHVRGNR